MADATFEDGREAPLNLGAMDAQDLEVLSALAQDAVFPITEMKWVPSERRFVVLLNRFRWEDRVGAEQRGRAVERVQSLLVIDNVLAVASQGIDRNDRDTVCSLLSVGFEETGEGSGFVHLTLAGDGGVRLKVEALEAGLKDVTRPYGAPSGQAPQHPE